VDELRIPTGVFVRSSSRFMPMGRFDGMGEVDGIPCCS